MSPKKPELELYIHIPFCKQKCLYCDFLSFPCMKDKDMDAYIKALIKEIRYNGNLYKDRYQIRSVFIGGGTPSILSAEAIDAICNAVKTEFTVSHQAEWTIEANPKTFDLDKARAWLKSGINRVSMGVQSLNPRLLKRIGRIHTAEQARRGYRILREAGFQNVSVDLMMGLPDQSYEDWMDTLQQVADWKPDHLSCYSLILEEGTPLCNEYEEGLLHLPDEECERRMYQDTIQYLKKHGYRHYEISNFAREGFESRHNIGYWKRIPYVGMGLGSASLIEEIRYSNPWDMKVYLKTPPHDLREMQEELDVEEQMNEYMMLGFRMTDGIDEKQYAAVFGVDIHEVHGESLQRLLRKKLIEKEDGHYRLTNRGLDLANLVFEEFV